MSVMRAKSEAAVGKFLRESGLRFKTLNDLPVRTIRHSQRGAVPGMRVAHLAPDLRDEFLGKAITRDLICLRAGFHQAPPTHYLPRPDGSPDCIFIYCTGGRGWLEMAGRAWTVEKYSGILIPNHVPHTYGADPDNPWTCYWAHFQGNQATEFTRMISATAGGPHIHLPQHDETVACIEQLYQQMIQGHTYTSLVAATGALSQLLGTVLSGMRAAEPRSRTAEDNLEKSVEFMHRNLAHRLTLKELASVAGMSTNHYGTLFGKRFNTPPMDYFNRLKIQRASELLSTTKLRVSEVAEQIGFDDPYYFSRLFKKIMGVAPRDYR